MRDEDDPRHGRLASRLGGGSGRHRLPHVPRELTLRTPLPDGPLFPVIVPVRDEQARLPGLLHALRQSQAEGAQWDIIVADDSSTDGSAALAVAAGAKVLSVSPPSGWNGKAWACQCGAEAASGDVLVFLDADTRPAPGFVERLASYASAHQAMVSVQPSHRPDQAYEQLSLVCNVVALMAGLGETSTGTRTWWRGPVGFGPAMAVPLQAYLRRWRPRLRPSRRGRGPRGAGCMSRAGLPVVALADVGDGGHHLPDVLRRNGGAGRGLVQEPYGRRRQGPRLALCTYWPLGHRCRPLELECSFATWHLRALRASNVGAHAPGRALPPRRRPSVPVAAGAPSWPCSPGPP